MKIDEDIKKFVKFLDNNKHYVGLSEWKIFVAIEPTEGKDALAEVDADIEMNLIGYFSTMPTGFAFVEKFKVK